MSAARNLDDESGDVPVTTWYNPLDVEQRVFLWMDGVRRKVVWKAKERRALPSIYDKAIQTVHGDTVVGGQAPRLVRETGEPPPKLHEDLDLDYQAKRQRAADAAAAVVTAHVARDLATIAEDIATTPEPKPVKK